MSIQKKVLYKGGQCKGKWKFQKRKGNKKNLKIN